MNVEIDKSSNEVIFTAPSCSSKVSVTGKVFLRMMEELSIKDSAYGSSEKGNKGSISLIKEERKVVARINITRQGSAYENYDPNDPPTSGGTTVISHDALPFNVEYEELQRIKRAIIGSKKGKGPDLGLLERLKDQQNSPLNTSRSDAQSEADADYADNDWRNECRGN